MARPARSIELNARTDEAIDGRHPPGRWAVLRHRLPGYAAFVWGVAFSLVHAFWLFGGTMGLPPEMSLLDNTPLLVIDIIAVPMCAAAAVLGLALVHPRWARLPRRLLLGAAVLASLVLLVHSVPAMIQLIAALISGTTETLGRMERFALFLYEPWFFIGGVLFTLATWRYWRRPAATNRPPYPERSP